MTPDTSGAAADVPPKEDVNAVSDDDVVVKIAELLDMLSAKADMWTFAPGVEKSVTQPS